ncbi:SRPBCC family protein [Microlunatus flavus]|uniref:Polyketide cyclase / dehydrase and lipid transport n=1 Tax=Microlunatus flavus TaxID=1036181 RepID=A0A1H9KDZ1_9ACTN|nr:SRPBCC family protein [Microlunatus flavus]SEQ97370.1 Polyketide cyclase / dehydrase and lipid transport [Microlunatus flavus]
MSLRLEVSRVLRARPERVWEELVDWPRQDLWIPFTHVRATGARTRGLGTRVAALSGFRLGPVPVGLLDRFVVTGWTPPDQAAAGSAAELAVLHLGPYFTGEGSFKVWPDPDGARLVCTEVFTLPGGAERLLRPALPVMRRAFAASLATLAEVVEAPDAQAAAA